MKYLIVSFFLFLFLGCDNKYSTDVNHANGETPVKNVLCSDGIGCYVSARFRDIDSCETYKEWAEMVCDKTLNPGKMSCQQIGGVKIVKTYCTL
jgi:hypothetical protein